MDKILLRLNQEMEGLQGAPPAKELPEISLAIKEEDSSLKLNPALKEVDLSIPVLPKGFLSLTFNDAGLPQRCLDQSVLPSAASKIFSVSIHSIEALTQHPEVKRIFKVVCKSRLDLDYTSGDAFGILAPNSSSEVMAILSHLGEEERAHLPCHLSCKVEHKHLPKHLPEVSTLYDLLKHFCEIRCILKKAFLRALAEWTTDTEQKRRLLELCSRQVSSDYDRFVKEARLNVSGLFLCFPSCRPPVELLLEFLPMLKPRFYSVACSPDPKSFSFVFSLVQFPSEDIVQSVRPRLGVCTGFFHEIYQGTNAGQLVKDFSRLNLDSCLLEPPPTFLVYKRINNGFSLPDSSIPLIMVGPGTGVAPFLGFLQNREKERATGETWLFFGCRHPQRDFIFVAELGRFKSEGVLNHLCLSFSRDEGTVRYVQDNIHLHSVPLLELIEKEGAKVYVCGDARNMAKDVFAAFVSGRMEDKGCSQEEATRWLCELQKRRQYVQDIWL